MSLRQAAALALEALNYPLETPSWRFDADKAELLSHRAITAIQAALDQPTPVQVSPVDFVEIVIEREHMVGKPVYWAQWPNEEKT